MRTVSKSATFLATESVNSASRGEKGGANFLARKAQNSSPILRCTFLARRSAKLTANFSATMVTSLPSFSLSLSLSLYLSLSLSHRMYLTHNIGSASALPIILNGNVAYTIDVRSLGSRQVFDRLKRKHCQRRLYAQQACYDDFLNVGQICRSRHV